MLRLPLRLDRLWGVHHYIYTSAPLRIVVPSARLRPEVLQRKIKAIPSSIAFIYIKKTTWSL
jgi:hypothetical protein